MFKFSSGPGASEAGLLLDFQRRQFLNRLIESDIIEDVLQSGDEDHRPVETGTVRDGSDAIERIIERPNLGVRSSGLESEDAYVDDVTCPDRLETFAGGWREFDQNRSMLTLSQRIAADYAQKYRRFALVAQLAIVLAVGPTAFMAWYVYAYTRVDVPAIGDHLRMVGRDTPTSQPAPVPMVQARPAPMSQVSVASVQPVSFVIQLVGDGNISASFPFEMRADDALGITSFVLIRGVPVGSTISYAQRLSSSVWVIPASALATSTLSVLSSAPRTFQLQLDAVSADGNRYASFRIDVVRRATDRSMVVGSVAD